MKVSDEYQRAKNSEKNVPIIPTVTALIRVDSWTEDDRLRSTRYATAASRRRVPESTTVSFCARHRRGHA